MSCVLEATSIRASMSDDRLNPRQQNQDRSARQSEQDEKGANLVEYVLLAALIAVVCIAAVQFVGNQASRTFNEVASHVGGAS